MTTLYCTKKLRKLLGLSETAYASRDGVPDDGWYANLLWLERRKCLLVTHAQTLYCLFMPDIKKADLSDLGALLHRHLHAQLEAEGLAEASLTLIEDDALQLAKAQDRRVLGSMNDQAYLLRCFLEDEGGLAQVDRQALVKRLNRVPMKKTSPQHRTGDYIYPIEAFQQKLGLAYKNPDVFH